ncbi:MAG TPA: DsbA family protein [Miltoncostaeaceae bacterium]|nr:DsbA family protein [Miltoncostaeaceae bacterium]
MSRKLIVGVIVAALAVVAVLVGVQLLSGDDTPSRAEDFEGREEIAQLLEGIPQDGRRLGRADAPVTIVEYIDYKCPICADASETRIPELIERYVRTGQAKLELRPIAFLGPDSERGALAGEAAAEQDRMWHFTELLLRNQGNENQEWITDDVVLGAAEAAGLDRESFEETFRGDDVVDRFLQARQQAQEDSVTGTPFWVISGPGGEDSFSGNAPLEQFQRAIADARGNGAR